MKVRIPRVVLATLLVMLVLGVLHALGARRSTAVLSGIVHNPLEAAVALTYVACWFITVLLAPIVLIGWLLLGADSRLRPRSSQARSPNGNHAG